MGDALGQIQPLERSGFGEDEKCLSVQAVPDGAAHSEVAPVTSGPLAGAESITCAAPPLARSSHSDAGHLRVTKRHERAVLLVAEAVASGTRNSLLHVVRRWVRFGW